MGSLFCVRFPFHHLVHVLEWLFFLYYLRNLPTLPRSSGHMFISQYQSNQSISSAILFFLGVGIERGIQGLSTEIGYAPSPG